MAAMAGEEKVTRMVLNVDLQCSKCYKKVKKLLCKFPEIRDQMYDEKANKVTIKVVCCSPEKIRDKLCRRGGGSIKSIEIKDGVLKPVTTMVLNVVVDLQCLKCYKKVKKLLCKFPEIRDQTYDEKANKVTIKVVSWSPEKIKDKLWSKGSGYIKSIEIKKLEKEKPPSAEPVKPPPPAKPVKPPPPAEPVKPPPPAEPVKTPPPAEPAPPPPLAWPPAWPPAWPTAWPPAWPPAWPTAWPPAWPPLPAPPPAEPDKTNGGSGNGGDRRSPKGSLPIIAFCCSEGSSHIGMPGNPCYGGGAVQYVGYCGRPIYDSWGGGWCDYFREENQQSCSLM